jgi:hypothetical protein
MSKIQNIAAELNMWANETERLYGSTKDIQYRRAAVHLRYIAASLLQGPNESTVTGDYIVLPTDSIILVDSTSGPVIITLPSIASANPQGYTIKNIGPNPVTINPQAGQTIEFNANVQMKNKTSLNLYPHLTNWNII